MRLPRISDVVYTRHRNGLHGASFQVDYFDDFGVEFAYRDFSERALRTLVKSDRKHRQSQCCEP